MSKFLLVGRIVVGNEDFVIEPSPTDGSNAVVVRRNVPSTVAGGFTSPSGEYIFDSLQDALQWIDEQERGGLLMACENS